MPPTITAVEDRQTWLQALACAVPDELAELLDPVVASLSIEVAILRRPEIGLALVTGRVGATGASFGLGEMTVTRCVVQFENCVGVGYVKGRDQRFAYRVAMADALLQSDHGDVLQDRVLRPLHESHVSRTADETAAVDATRVQFLTVVRGN